MSVCWSRRPGARTGPSTLVRARDFRTAPNRLRFPKANGGAIELGAAVDLCGRRVAYVGGRAGIVGHFRALVERLNGHFIHHDGGIEDHEGQLGRILGQADVVLCPVDCVSHRACLRAKRFCKRTAKPFVPLRSVGLSSFVTGLRRAAESDSALEPQSAERTD